MLNESINTTNMTDQHAWKWLYMNDVQGRKAQNCLDEEEGSPKTTTNNPLHELVNKFTVKHCVNLPTETFLAVDSLLRQEANASFTGGDERGIAVGRLKELIGKDLLSQHHINDTINNMLLSIIPRGGPPLTDTTMIDSLLDLLLGLVMECGQHLTPHAKIKAAFLALDMDQSGGISKDEFSSLLVSTTRRLCLDLDDRAIAAMCDVLFDAIDDDKSGEIDFSEFLRLFEEVNPDLMSVFETTPTTPTASIDSHATLSKRPSKTALVHIHPPSWIANMPQILKTTWSNDPFIIVWLLVYLRISIFLFQWKYVFYLRDEATFDLMGHCVGVARGTAIVINFNISLILWPVIRPVLTWLRGTFLRHIMPFDEAIEFHKLGCVAILILSLVHTAAHACNISRITSSTPEQVTAAYGYERFGGEVPTVGDLLSSLPAITGIIMLVIFAIAYPLTMTGVRRRHFRLFWLTHHLFVMFLLIVCCHGAAALLEPPTTIYWAMVPITVYVAERLRRMFALGGLATEIVKAEAKGGGVVALQMKRPPSWECKAGQYVFLHIPEVSKVEWHPFTLTSAPCTDFIEVHVRAVGKWTRDLLNLTDEINAHNIAVDAVKTGILQMGPGSNSVAIPKSWRTHIPYPRVLLEGPMGAPAERFNDFKVIVLVGAGIGFTPMASVLRQLLADYNSPNAKCQKVFTVWTSRNAEDFSWFSNIINEIAKGDVNRMIEIHNYLTSVKQSKKAGFGDVLLNTAQQMAIEAGLPDAVSGLRTRTITHYGRPNWDDFFQHVIDTVVEVSTLFEPGGGDDVASGVKLTRSRKKVTVGVFFCGPHVMGKTIHAACTDTKGSMSPVGFKFFSEKF